MSYKTVSIIIIVLSSLIIVFSIFKYAHIFKDKEAREKMGTGNLMLGVFIFTFWASMLVGGILLLQKKEVSALILYWASYLMLFILLVQLVRDFIGYYKARYGKNNEDKSISLKTARQSALRSVIEFVVISAIIMWFQDWLYLLPELVQ